MAAKKRRAGVWKALSNPKGTHWIVINGERKDMAAMFFDGTDHGRQMAREYAAWKNRRPRG